MADQQFPDNEDSREADSGSSCRRSTRRPRRCGFVLGGCAAQLDSIPRAELSPCRAVELRRVSPADRSADREPAFRDYEMPVNADTTFWTDLGYTARRPFRMQDYRIGLDRCGIFRGTFASKSMKCAAAFGAALRRRR